MKRCHYHTCKEDGKKYIIPYCYSMMYSDDMRDCTCPKPIVIIERQQKPIDKIISDLNTDSIITGLLF